MREPLNNTTHIKLYAVDPCGAKAENESVFVINSLKEESEAGFVYSAAADGKEGTLIELFPDEESLGLSRDRYHCVKASKATAEAFDGICAGFAESVYAFSRLCDEKADCGFFANTVYRGYTKKGDPKGTVYMFSPSVSECVGFGTAVDGIVNSGEHPQLKLAAAVTLFIGLSRQLLCLHRGGFSLGACDAEKDILVTPEGRVVIDPGIGHITPAADDPEGNRNDIYRAGELFRAMLVSLTGKTDDDCLPDEIFAQNRYYMASGVSAKLAEILRKTLYPNPAYRYSCAEELLEKLNGIRLAFAPADFAECGYDADIPMEVFAENIPVEKTENPADSVRDLLIREPLYKYSPDGEIEISVVGTYPSALEFIRRARICSALLCRKCNITLFSDFDISAEGAETVSGISFSMRGNARNKQNAGKVTEKADYVFIDYGTDELNFVIAKAVLKRVENSGKKVCVAFAATENGEYGKGRPVFVNRTDFVYNDDRTCERLVRLTAFDNADRNALFKKYKNPKPSGEYYRNIEALMKLSYMLHSLGSGTEEELLGRLGTVICGGGIAPLIVCQHNANLLDAEYVRKNPEYAVPCANEGTIYGLPASRWPVVADASVDMLDRASVEAAGRIYEEYKQIKNSDAFETIGDNSYKTLQRDCGKVDRLFGIIGRNDLKTEKLLNEYVRCLDSILGLSVTALRRREKCKNDLLNNVNAREDLTADQKKFIRSSVAAVDRLVEPAAEYLTLESPKKKYAANVMNLGYIFTGGSCKNLLIPFYVGANNNMLGNVASLMVIKPEKVTFVSLSQTEECFDKAIETLRFIGRVLKNHGIRCEIHIEQYCAFPSVLRLGEYQLAANSIGATYNICSCENLFDGIDKICEYCRTQEFSLIERNHSELSNMLLGAGLYRKIPSFEFDSSVPAFRMTSGCTWLHGLKQNCSLKISDMFDVTCDDMSVVPDMLCDRERMFEFYSESSFGWKKLAETLDAYHQKRDLLLMLTQKDGRNPTYKPRSFIIDANTAQTVVDVLGVLVKAGFADSESYVRYRSENSCMFYLSSQYQPVVEFFVKALTGEKHTLADKSRVRPEYDVTTGTVRVFYDSLFVENYPVSANDFRMMEFLLRDLEKELYIVGLKIAGGEGTKNISFKYATSAIKAMLTQAGRVLELHTYSSLNDCGEFDEVLCNCRVRWPGSNVSNEFDCIAVKGFSTVFVECKAQNRIDQNFYYKLGALVSKFGINPQGFIIADTNSAYFDGNNQMQIDRGNGLNICTITDKKEIKFVGRTIASMI